MSNWLILVAWSEHRVPIGRGAYPRVAAYTPVRPDLDRRANSRPYPDPGRSRTAREGKTISSDPWYPIAWILRDQVINCRELRMTGSAEYRLGMRLPKDMAREYSRTVYLY